MNRLNNIKGAIFDLDGTILDTNGLWIGVDRVFFEKRGIEMPADYPDKVSTMDFYAAARYTIKRFDLPDTPSQLLEEWKSLTVKVYSEKVRLTPGAGEYLKKLDNNGVKLGVATSALPELFVPALKNNGIYDIFSALTSTAEVGKGKEYPEVYLETAKKLGLKPNECAVFEDVYLGVKSAKSAGFLTVWIRDHTSLSNPTDDYADADIKISSFLSEIFK